MMIYPDTWNNVLEASKEGGQPSLLRVFVYCAAHSGEVITRSDFQAYTGDGGKNIKAALATLVETGFIVIKVLTHNKKQYTISNPVNFSLDVTKLSIYNNYIDRYSKRGEAQHSDVQTGKFTLDDVVNDEDWLKAKAILLKYFKEHQITPHFLVGEKQYFNKLLAVLSDDDVDFDKYCEWYRVNKYPYKKFKYGLLLHPGMVSEFKDSEDDEDDRYMNTAALGAKKKFQEDAEKAKDFIRELTDEGKE